MALPLALDLARLIGTSLDLMTRYLTRIVAEVWATGADATHCAPPHFVPTRAINESAVSSRADLLAMATAARGPLGRVLLGSVADKVVRTADHPVLLYRQAGEIGA
ncbi:MAG: universal stress protein [Gemmatimonas sp.]|uniref:universal stress protein n=1 Tax=Gemmatimonas sp. TaxID=1962908 RepID=UPI00391F4192|nr:universal stress protein [Gemmatimonadota bacterium]